ncbi:MAG: hypothetical protein JNK23_01080 [Opitutaceae bacterium]|nr:hypothetical protein [Opitutaceae bacterium]
MKRLAFMVGGVGLVVAFVAFYKWPARPGAEPMAGSRAEPAAVGELVREVEQSAPKPERGPTARTMTALEKAARVAAIRRDYEELRRRVAGELAATEAATLTDAKVLLRQLALLEAELHADLGRVLDPGELEEFELRESITGVRVTQRLAGTAASEAQRRAVFRAQRAFDLKYAFALELDAEALAERERARQETEARIRAVLGEALFAAWSGGAR